ncbi:MAG: type I methionyl aminopeptidase [Vicinamibacterales bacterium]
MSIESQEDWDGLRAVSRIARQTLTLLTREVRPGVTTGELDALARRFLRSRGARSAPAMVYGFPGTVLISIDDEVVHGVPGKRRVHPGDLVSLDVTVELNGYVTDAARSIVVPPATNTALELIACARAAFDAALLVARAGTPVREIGRAIQHEVEHRGFAVVRGLSGHGVGRTIHEPPSVPNEWDPTQTDILTEGLVITIEPMVTTGSGRPVERADGWTIATRDRSLAAHHEDTIVITKTRPVVLTGAAA